MPDPLLSVRTGAADPPTMALPPGQAIGPLSVGRAGTWRVVAPGVLEEHAFLYFNGTDLFLQSANPNSPVMVNGAPIPGDWTPVYAPCEISIGGARVWFGPPEPVRSRPPAAPSRPPPPAASRPFVPRVHGIDQDDEHTRLQPIEEIQASRPRTVPPAQDQVGATLKSPVSMGAQPVSMGGPPASVGAPTFNPPTAVMGPGPLFGPPPPMMGGDPGAPPLPGPEMPPLAPAAPPKKESWIGARWREASTPKKALMVLLVPLIWAVWVIFTDKPPPARPAKPAASASASPSAKPSAGPTASAAPTVAAQPPPTPPAPASTPSGKASSASSAAPATTTKTPQREAADAVAVGAYDKAARLYEELAKAHPDVPAYAEAARIMKAKAGKR